MAGQLWVRVIRKNKIIESRTAPCTYETWQQALDDICHGLDISRPVILPRHERDWEQFGLTHFLPEHFLESVHFDKLELQYIDPDKKRKKQFLRGAVTSAGGEPPRRFLCGEKENGGRNGRYFRASRRKHPSSRLPFFCRLTRFAAPRRLYG